MDNRKEALGKALESGRAAMSTGVSKFAGVTDMGDKIMLQTQNGSQMACKDFPYTEREAPAKGTIVEVWDNGEYATVAYSLGKLHANGRLMVSNCRDGAYCNSWEHWHIVGEQGEMVRTETVVNKYGKCRFGNCKYACTHAWESEPCKGCMTKTTVPTNYEEDENAKW
jgi:hypothetical protein